MPTQVEIDHDYKRLKVLLEDTNSFVLAFVLYRDIEEQRENATKLRGLLDLPVTERGLEGDNLNPVYTFLDLPREPRQAIFYTFLGSSLPEGKSDFDKFAGYVNIQREAFTDAPHAVVLWLREEQLVRLMRRAPDFWAWRSGVFDVRGELQLESPAYREPDIEAFYRVELEHSAALYREILKEQLARELPDLAYIARTRFRLSVVLRRLGLYNEMAVEAQEVMKIAEVLEDDIIRTAGLHELGAAYQALGHFSEAEALYREVIDLSTRVLGKEHRLYTSGVSDLASLLYETGRYSEAELMYREVIALGTQGLDEEHPDYTSWLNGLAMLLETTNRFDEAETLYRKALKINEDTVGREHPHYASELNNLAVLLERTNRYDEAELLYREAVELTAKTLGKEHPNYANRLSNFANLLAHMGRYDEAEILYREVVKRDEERLGKTHPTYAKTLYNLAGLLQKMKRYSEALTSYHEALRILVDIFGEGHPNTRLVADNYKLLLQQLEQPSTPSTSG